MKYTIKKKNYNDELTDMALCDLLTDRGVEEPEKWLNPNYSFEHSPFLFGEMKKSLGLLRQTLKNPEAVISVVVDSDLDGYTSGAIILTLLKLIQRGQEIVFLLHPNKEHGIVLDDIPEDTDLIIVPDAGRITA